MREDVVGVRDGRKVAYGEFGSPHGVPVLVCHGSAESRLFEADPDWTAQRGVRVITPDRPGFGGSDPLPSRTLLGWAEDAGDLLDALSIDECRVIGWSGGGPHALAAAYALGSRVRRVALVASFAPVHLIPAAYEAMAPHLQVLADLAPSDPQGTAALVAEFAKPWVDDPDTFTLGGESPPEDAAIETDPVWGRNLQAQIHEGLRRADGIAWDAAVLYAPWGFNVQDVHQQIHAWHGRADDVTPIHNGEWLAETLPNATLHTVDAGHFLIYPHWHVIIETLLN